MSRVPALSYKLMNNDYISPALSYTSLLCASGLLQQSIQQVDPYLETGVAAETYSRDGSGFSWDLDV